MPVDQLFPDLPAALVREVFADLCASLPLPLDDTPEARASRDDVAITAVAALHPTDAFEAKLAARIVAMDAHAADCLHSAASFAAADPAEARRCRNQAASMARQSDSALNALKRMQAVRDKQIAEMHPAAMERAGYWFHDCSVPAPVPSPEVPPEQAEPKREFAQMTDAERYAVLYADRAAAIRATGGMPPDAKFAPPEAELMRALLASSSPILRKLDVSHAATPSHAGSL